MRHYNSKFEDKYPGMLIDYFTAGRSQARFCADLTICRTTFYEWIDRYPRFKEAYAIAKMKSEAHYLDLAEDNAGNPDFNFNIVKFILSNRHGVTQKRKQSAKWLNTKDLIGSFDKMLKMFRGDDLSHEEMSGAVKILLDLANLKERGELQDRVAQLEESLREQNESS